MNRHPKQFYKKCNMKSSKNQQKPDSLHKHAKRLQIQALQRVMLRKTVYGCLWNWMSDASTTVCFNMLRSQPMSGTSHWLSRLFCTSRSGRLSFSDRRGLKRNYLKESEECMSHAGVTITQLNKPWTYLCNLLHTFTSSLTWLKMNEKHLETILTHGMHFSLQICDLNSFHFFSMLINPTPPYINIHQLHGFSMI